MKRVGKAGRGELAFAGSLLLLGFFVLYDTKKMEVAEGVAIISPRLFPYFVGTFLIVVSAGLILTVLRGNLAVPEGTEPGDAFVPADFKTMSLVVAGIAGHSPHEIGRAWPTRFSRNGAVSQPSRERRENTAVL